MEVGMLIFVLTSLAVVVVVAVAMPELSRPTVPLGVSVPSERVTDPVVRSAVNRFRLWSLVGGAAAGIATVVTAPYPGVSALVLLGFVGWVMGTFAVCRRPIIMAKTAGNWYGGRTVRIIVPVVPERLARPVWALLILAVSLSLAAIGMVLTVWGEASPSVLVVGLIGLGITVSLATASVLISHRHDAQLPDGDLQVARQLQRARARSLQIAFGWSAVGAALVFATMTVGSVIQLNKAALGWSLWALLVANTAPVFWLILDSIVKQRQASAAGPGKGPESPDDDRFWKWGLFYINHEDPRMFVPKRNGIGYESNLGHPGGVALTGGLVLLLFGCVVLIVSLQF